MQIFERIAFCNNVGTYSYLFELTKRKAKHLSRQTQHEKVVKAIREVIRAVNIALDKIIKFNKFFDIPSLLRVHLVGNF